MGKDITVWSASAYVTSNYSALTAVFQEIWRFSLNLNMSMAYCKQVMLLQEVPCLPR